MLLDLKELLRKYKNNTCTLEELEKLRTYFSERKHELLIKQSLYKELENYVAPPQTSSVFDSKRIFENVQSKLNESVPPEVFPHTENRRRNVYVKILKIAAVIIPAFILGGILSHHFMPEIPVPEKTTNTEIRSPYGARSEVMLPDGSTVWLNAGSKITYSSDFNKNSREIQLSGEGYFKVARNADMPFRVKAGDLSIQAIGTEFNVKSYDDEDIIETTLVEGKISIRQSQKQKKSIYLQPHQKAIYVKYNKNLTVTDLKLANENKHENLTLKKGIIYIAVKIDPVPVVAWKENRLIIKGEELNTLAIKLERKYDVKFVFESESLKMFRFTGTLENETLTQVLDVIKLSAPLEYKLQGKTVMIFENKRMTEKFNTHMKKK
jgi:ferric-dicitrate binding protein FerR (iron transport regulator)